MCPGNSVGSCGALGRPDPHLYVIQPREVIVNNTIPSLLVDNVDYSCSVTCLNQRWNPEGNYSKYIYSIQASPFDRKSYSPSTPVVTSVQFVGLAARISLASTQYDSGPATLYNANGNYYQSSPIVLDSFGLSNSLTLYAINSAGESPHITFIPGQFHLNQSSSLSIPILSLIVLIATQLFAFLFC